MVYNVIVHFDGSFNYKIEAKNEEEANEIAMNFFDRETDSAICDRICDVKICDTICD